MRAEELDKIFDEGTEDILPYLDMAKAVRPSHQAKQGISVPKSNKPLRLTPAPAPKGGAGVLEALLEERRSGR